MTSKKTKKWNLLEQVALPLNICIMSLSLILIIFMRFHSPVSSFIQRSSRFSTVQQSELADRLSVIILLLLCGIVFLILPKMVKKYRSESSILLITSVSLTVTILAISWRWGDSTFAEYREVFWYGWGDKFALLLLICALTITFTVSNFADRLSRIRLFDAERLLNMGAFVVLFCFYLPSMIQPFKGIIDKYHSRYVLNDLLIVASGKLPYSEITPGYLGFLGWPLKIFAFLPADWLVNTALIWVNFLVLFEIFCIAYLTRKALQLKYWGLPILIPVSLIFIKVQPNLHSIDEVQYRAAWGSVAQFMSIFPGRSVMPIFLLFLVSELASIKRGRRNTLIGFLTGLFLVFTSLNNIEFGIPASITAIINLFFITRLSLISRQDLKNIAFGTISAVATIFFVYSFGSSEISFAKWIVMAKVHGVDGFANLPMPIFGLWIFFYSILGSSAVIGSNFLFRVFMIQRPNQQELQSVLLLTFGGLWGSSTLFYYSGGSMATRLIPSIIPLSLCIVGLGGLIRSKLKSFVSDRSGRANSKNLFIAFTPLFCLVLIPVISLTQAPNPAFEWLRMGGKGDRWSSRALKETEIYIELKQLQNNTPSIKYVYMGNDGPAISLLSGVENGLGIILLSDLLIDDELREVGCRPALESSADFILVPKVDWFRKVDWQRKTDRIQIDNWLNPEFLCPGFVLHQPKSDSPFLYFKIPSKVQS